MIENAERKFINDLPQKVSGCKCSNQPEIALHGIVDFFKSDPAGLKQAPDEFHPADHALPCAFPHADRFRRDQRADELNRKPCWTNASLVV